MTKLSRKKLPKEVMGNYINNLWSAFTLASSKADIKDLFKDLFSHTEYKMFAKRFEIAKRLLGEESYVTIQRELNVTPVTISRMSNILEEKGEGLRKAVDKINKLEEKYWEQQKERIKNLENPFRQKAKRKTVLGAVLKAGIKFADKKLTQHLKHKTASTNLEI